MRTEDPKDAVVLAVHRANKIDYFVLYSRAENCRTINTTEED